jgi:alpha-tubulin suppressor-like RCC1 family protein
VRTAAGHAFSFGRNSYGQLGLGDFADRDQPYSMHFRGSPLFKKTVALVAASRSNSAVVTRPSSSTPSSSSSSDTNNSKSAAAPAAGAAARELQALEEHERERSEVFTMGSLRAGNLGSGEAADCQPKADPYGPHCCRATPGVVPELRGKDVVRLSLGAEHAAAIDGAGRLWTWGKNASGCLGNGNFTSLWRPTLIAGYGEFFAEVSCGEAHTLAIGFDNNVYAWGSNRNGQLGFQSSNSSSSSTNASSSEWNAPCPAPKLVMSLYRKGVTKVRAGRHHSACVTEEGDGWSTWIVDTVSALDKVRFHKLKPKLPLVDVVCTPLDTNVAIDAQGLVHAWEHNHFEEPRREHALETRRLTHIDAGLEHIAIVGTINKRWRTDAMEKQ